MKNKKLLRAYYVFNDILDAILLTFFLCGLASLLLGLLVSFASAESVYDFLPVSRVVFPGSAGQPLTLPINLDSSYQYVLDWVSDSEGYSAPFRVLNIDGGSSSLGAYSNPSNSTVHFFGRTFNNVSGPSYRCSYSAGVARCNGLSDTASPASYSGPFYLGGYWTDASYIRSGAYFAGYINSFQVYDSDGLQLLDLVPVSDGSHFGYFDNVSGTFLYNSVLTSPDVYSGNIFSKIFKVNIDIFKGITLSDLFLEYLPFGVALFSVVLFIRLKDSIF